jgi:hypothetical protein
MALLRKLLGMGELCICTSCKRGINWMIMLNHVATHRSLLPATLQDVRFGIKFVFSSKTEIIDGGEGFESSNDRSTENSFTFYFAFFSPAVLNEDILDVMFGWRALFSADKLVN